MSLTTEEKIAAIEQSDMRIVYDGCHKIYFIENEEQARETAEFGYDPGDFHKAKEIRQLINGSCFLVFVHPWASWERDEPHPWDIEQGEIEGRV